MSLSNELQAIQIQLRQDLDNCPSSVVDYCFRLMNAWKSEKEQKEQLVSALQELLSQSDVLNDFSQIGLDLARENAEAAIAKATVKETV